MKKLILIISVLFVSSGNVIAKDYIFEGSLAEHWPIQWKLKPNMQEAYTLRFNPTQKEGGRLLVKGSKSFHVELDGQASGTLPLDTQVSTGSHRVLLVNNKDNVQLNFTLQVYAHGYMIWYLKKDKKQWGINHYGFKKSKKRSKRSSK